MNISLTLEFHKCKRSSTDIERNSESEEEKALIANTENENLDCSDKGKNAVTHYHPKKLAVLFSLNKILLITI